MMENTNKETYNGWANRQTWNVALWINNDYGLYTAARNFMKTYNGNYPYRFFIKRFGMENERTPDNIKYISQKINFAELNEMMMELKED